MTSPQLVSRVAGLGGKTPQAEVFESILVTVAIWGVLEAAAQAIGIVRVESSYALNMTAASSLRLVTVMSGLASADLTAPTPGRAEGRFTHTVARPRACAGTTS